MFNNTREIDEYYYHSAYLAIIALLVFVGIFGVFFNLLVMIVIFNDSKSLQKPINIILLNLAFSGFLVALLGDPLVTVSAYYGVWYWSHDACVWYAWLMSTLGYANIGHLTVMAIERWFLVVKTNYALNIKSAIILTHCAWIYAFSLSLPPLVGWGMYGQETTNISCSVRWEVRNIANTDTYIAFIFVFGLIIPVIIITAAYVNIISTLKKVKKRIGASGRRERKVTKMVALMIAAFIFAWTPYAIFALAVQYFHYNPTGLVSIVPTLIAKTSICYNPIIYAGSNTQFQHIYRKCFRVKDTNFLTH